MDLLKSVTIEIGKRLRTFREQRGLSQKEFADRLRVPANYISRYEAGLHLPSPDVVAKLKKTFGLNEFWLASGTKIEGFSVEWSDLMRLVQGQTKMQDVGAMLESIWSHDAPPLTIEFLKEKLNLSSAKAKQLLFQLLEDGFIVGIGNGSYVANPFYPFAAGIQDYAAFLNRSLQLVRIYIEGDSEKIARIGGMLDMADPGLDFIKKYSSRLLKEKTKEGI
jgi:transcriptional regulator with XRE-family HTH domain